MRLFSALHSPAAVVGLAFGLATAWTLLYEGAAGESRAAAESPRRAPEVERSAHGTDSAAAAASVVRAAIPLRQGPRLLREPPEDVLGLDISIEDRDGQSMAALHEALRRAERGEGQARLVFYGASHVASDLFTGYLRRELQRRYGDAGHGVVLPAHPWRTYRHRGVEVESNRRMWDSTKVRASSSEVDYFGVHGVYVESNRRGAYGRVRTASSGTGSSASLFDVYYLQRPGGGSFDVLMDGRPAQQVTTQSDAAGPGYATFRVPDGAHQLELRLRGDGPVRFFGVAVERETPGVIVDTLGINGARARYHLLWEDALYREHLRRRNPDLVVLAYGTNESGDDAPIERYEAELRGVLQRVREVAPQSSCLLIGPSDRPVRREDGSWEDRPRTAAIVNAQYRAAVEHGCGFFDLISFSGGPMSMVEWAAADPPYGAPDHVHYTRRGYTRLGEVLLGALLEGM
ncbi:MAG: GDSL-type esterase/lipase family protein [Myxococcota bacterium]